MKRLFYSTQKSNNIYLFSNKYNKFYSCLCTVSWNIKSSQVRKIEYNVYMAYSVFCKIMKSKCTFKSIKKPVNHVCLFKHYLHTTQLNEAQPKHYSRLLFHSDTCWTDTNIIPSSVLFFNSRNLTNRK